MTEKEFLVAAEDFIYKEVAKNTNLILGKNKTAGLSTGLFLKLPIVVSVEKVDQPLPKLYKELSTFMPYFSAYTKSGNTTETFFTFMYHDEKDFNKLYSNLQRRGVFLAFVYMHEIQHIIRKHVTSSYDTLMNRIAGDIPNAHHEINIAEDHAINYSIKDLFMLSDRLKSKWAEIEEISCYKKKYHDNQMSDIDILKDIIANSPCDVAPLGNGFDSVESDGKESVQPSPGMVGGGNSSDTDNGEGYRDKSVKGDKISTTTDDMDNSLADLAESIQDIIRSNTKGTGAGVLFEKVFDSVKVETGWFKKIKASFKRNVFYKTHDYATNWANLNNTFRRIYKSPKKQFMDDKISIILSVDHSGSMATEDLQKLLYLIESESNKISSLTVLIHDYTVTKAFNIEDEYDIAKNPGFTEALAVRYSAGGTSHGCVFEYIQNMKLEDPNKVIYMSFSDNYSDIESVFSTYPVMRRLTNYWVSPVNNPVKVPGTNINMV